MKTGQQLLFIWNAHQCRENKDACINIVPLPPGHGWSVVDYPDEDTRLMQVSVGRHAVWAVSRDGGVGGWVFVCTLYAL